MTEKKATAGEKPVDQLSFEQALAELETIVRQLEAGSGDLESSIGAYERGVLLKDHCAARLKEAESRIEKITLVAAKGTDKAAIETAPFDDQPG